MKKLKKWAIIHSDRAYDEYETFIHELQSTCQNDFMIQCTKPHTHCIRGRDFDFRNWRSGIEQIYEELGELELLIVIAPGRKNASPIYNDLKYYMQQQQCVTQVVL